MEISAQNTGFGSIKIKGVKKQSPQLRIAKRLLQKEFLPLQKGATESGKKARYIQTEKGSPQERVLIARLKKVLSKFYRVEIKKISDEKAAQNITRHNQAKELAKTDLQPNKID